MIKLYYAPNNASLAPHFLLHHIGAQYELIPVDKDNNAHKAPDYLKLNPTGRIPALVMDGQPMFESAAICVHLCERHPDCGLMPALGHPDRPLFFQWLAFLNNTLQADLLVYYHPERYTTDPGGIADVQSAIIDRIAQSLNILDQQLRNATYLVGDQLSACDYFLFMLAGWVPESVEFTRFERLTAYLQRMSMSPTIKAVYRAEGLDLEAFVGRL
ncbi:MAG: glutathione S-transferase family protein [Gammaproteobacteria bacterium]|nr:glutathione S-transferase family protein [Gammaproteobacteria bacterium]